MPKTKPDLVVGSVYANQGRRMRQITAIDVVGDKTRISYAEAWREQGTGSLASGRWLLGRRRTCDEVVFKRWVNRRVN